MIQATPEGDRRAADGSLGTGTMTSRLDPYWRWLSRRAIRRHLSESHLVALALNAQDTPAPVAAAAARHLLDCDRCEERLDALRSHLATMPEVASAGFEEAFTPSRLRAQRARIGHRLAHLVGKVQPGRVLAFPFAGQPFRRLDVRVGRWLAAAAAAGLLLGITAGQLIQYGLSPTGTAAETSATARQSLAGVPETFDVTAVQPDRLTVASPLTLDEFAQVMMQVTADEEFLGSLERALTSVPVSEFETIDALTPRVGDLAINIR